MDERIAIIDNGKVVNVIVGKFDEIKNLFAQGTAILETPQTNVAWIGARWNGEKFEALRIYPSWIWNEETFEYDPPKPKPGNDYFWDEKNQNWVKAEPAAIPTLQEIVASGLSEEEAKKILDQIQAQSK